jgi:hypothetical protein
MQDALVPKFLTEIAGASLQELNFIQEKKT